MCTTRTECKLLLVGTHADSTKKEVNDPEIMELLNSLGNGIKYCEVSSKTGEGIEDAFN